MPDVARMNDFTYDPFAEKTGKDIKGVEASEAMSTGSTPAETSLVIDPQKGNV